MIKTYKRIFYIPPHPSIPSKMVGMIRLMPDPKNLCNRLSLMEYIQSEVAI